MGTWLAGINDFKNSTFPIEIFGVVIPCYAAFSTLIVNIAVAVVLSFILNALSKGPRTDATVPADYY